MGFAFFTTPCLKFARPPKPLLLYVSIKCDGSLFLYAGMTMNFLYLSPSLRTDGWPVNSNSAQKKVLPIFSVRCALHLQLLMFPYMHYLYIWFLFLRGNSLTCFLDVRCLRDECVCDFRLWHARFSFLPTRGSMCCVNLLPFMALLLRNFGGPFM